MTRVASDETSGDNVMLNPGKAIWKSNLEKTGLLRGGLIKYHAKAFCCRGQTSSEVFFDPSTGITSIILANTEFIGLYTMLTRNDKKIEDFIVDCPLIVINIPPVLNENGQQAIVKTASSVESLIFKSQTLFLKSEVFEF